MRIASPLRAAAAALLLTVPALSRGEEPAPAAVPAVPRRWLALEPVDAGGRVPFNRNAVFARYLLDRSAPPPVAGEKVKGSAGEAAWREVETGHDGTVPGGRGEWFHAAVEAPADVVAMARLSSAGVLFVNGAGFPGDSYAYGVGPFPVALRKGRNDLYVARSRGPWSLALDPCVEGASPILPQDATIPDLVPGDRGTCLGAVRVVNPTEDWLPGPTTVHDAAERFGRYENPPLPPLGTTKWPFTLGSPRPGEAGSTVTLRLQATTHERMGRASAKRELGPPVLFEARVRRRGELRRVTFSSDIDDSVQWYALLPPSPPGAPPGGRPAVALSLHGAGVDAMAQAGCYVQRPDFVVVAPTNRRPFGFDWQDWGRADAYEALETLSWRTYDTDRVLLTGHSMGGHGTWNLAANDPDRWVAVAPSAGWSTFDSYGGGGRPRDALSAIWRGADAEGRLEDLVSNLVPLPTFVLHGTTDDNVPLSEAQGMLRRIEAAGGRPAHHFQEGAGHWWDGNEGPGTDCVDWPAFFELARSAPREREPDALDFVTADPGIDSEHFWVRVTQPLEYGRPSRVRGRRSGAPRPTVTLETENVRRLEIRPRLGVALERVVLDGEDVGGSGMQSWGAFLREEDGWTRSGWPAGEKGPRWCGPFKRAFDRGFQLVVGTKGTPEENRELLELARFHAALWSYAANGTATVVRDVDVRVPSLVGVRVPSGGRLYRNYVLYGNADTNAAWDVLLPASSPIQVRRGEIRLGDRTWRGDDLGAVFVHRAVQPNFLVGAFASTGPRGTRVAYGLLPFTSGVGYPDYALFGPGFLAEGDGGVLAAGWFDARWGLQPGGVVRGAEESGK